MHTCYVSYNLSVFLSHFVGRSKHRAVVCILLLTINFMSDGNSNTVNNTMVLLFVSVSMYSIIVHDQYLYVNQDQKLKLVVT